MIIVGIIWNPLILHSSSNIIKEFDGSLRKTRERLYCLSLEWFEKIIQNLYRRMTQNFLFISSFQPENHINLLVEGFMVYLDPNPYGLYKHIVNKWFERYGENILKTTQEKLSFPIWYIDLLFSDLMWKEHSLFCYAHQLLSITRLYITVFTK